MTVILSEPYLLSALGTYWRRNAPVRYIFCTV